MQNPNIKYFRDELNKTNDLINETLWGDKERLYYLQARKRFLEFCFQISSEDNKSRP